MRLTTFFIFFLFCLIQTVALSQEQDTVQVTINVANRTGGMSNGIIRIYFNNQGQAYRMYHNDSEIIGSLYGGRFYFSYVSDDYHELEPESISAGSVGPDIGEITYKRTSGELAIEQTYVLFKGMSGLYCYIVVKGLVASVKAREIRMVYRVRPSEFTYGYVADNIQGPMVTPEQLQSATQIMDATYQLTDGSIYTKYDWANYEDRDFMNGLISANKGFWVISASDEYVNGGPMKQELMVHATTKTPIVLKMLQGEHFGAAAQYFTPTDEKMYGPFFIYINEGDSREAIIEDAKQKARDEVMQWPYSWMNHPMFPLDRSTVEGKLQMSSHMKTLQAMVVLAQPGEEIYNQGKDYIYWAKTDSSGNFSIPHVRLETYTLYAYAIDGDVTDELQVDGINAMSGLTNIGTLDWTFPKSQRVLWRIGKANRRATEFKLGHEPRRYGMWEDVPASITYDVENSSWADDWYYAQTKEGTWTIRFNIDQQFTGNALLTIAVAGVGTDCSVQVNVNGAKQKTLSFDNDASVYRSANTSGRYRREEISFPTSLLNIGENTVELKLLSVGDRGGVMYDIIKLEVQDPTNSIETNVIQPEHLTLQQNYPNPFNSKTIINYQLSANSFVVLKIYDITGKEVKTIINKSQPAGHHSVTFDASDLVSGIYFYKLKADKFEQSRKMMLLR